VSTRTWLATDYYELLGVERGAGTEEIARAFRAAAKDHHPDRTDDPEARERFTVLSEAYGVLGNPERRARYDELRAAPIPDPRAVRPAPARAPNPAAPAVPVPDETRPLSVRAFPERRHGRWASIGGVVLLVAGIAAAVLVAGLAVSGPGVTENGSDPTGRLLTLGLVALKLVVVGIVFCVLGNRRGRHP
jgi:hypothetical protein